LISVRVFFRYVPERQRVVAEVIVQFDEAWEDCSAGVYYARLIKARWFWSRGGLNFHDNVAADVNNAVLYYGARGVHGDNPTS
jgi:hypothetical protein